MVKSLELICRDLLRAIGEDPEREGLRDTPRRWAAMWREFIDFDAGNIETTFQPIIADQMVVARGIKVWSMCEHHLAPFWCRVSIGYIPDQSVLGLSKFARIAHKHAHRLQIQERLVEEIAAEVMQVTKCQDVAVIASGEHLCMSTRGIKTEAEFTSSIMKGKFKHASETRAEFMSIAGY
jgi:GTP cyclohydrolase I